MYQALLGGEDDVNARRRALPLLLNSGQFAIAGRGGTQVGGWNVTLPAPGAFRWTNRDRLAAVTRGQPMQIEWKGSEVPQRVMIVAGTYAADAQVSGFCQCMAGPADRHMAIPAAALEGLPDGLGYVWLIGLPNRRPPAIPATGIDQSAAISVYCQRQEFRFVSTRP